MPIVYRCSRCGFPLYVYARVGQTTSGIRTPSEVAYMYGYRCPRCGKPLKRPDHRDVVIDTNVVERVRELIEQAERENVPIAYAYQHLVTFLERRAQSHA